MLMAANDRAEGLAAAAELRSARRYRDGRGRCPSACTSCCRSVRISARPLVLCVPAWRLASCQRTQRCRMSSRGSRPKIVVGQRRACRPSLPSRVVILSSIITLSLGLWLRPRLQRRSRVSGSRRASARPWADRPLGRVAHQDPGALGAGNGAPDQDQAALGVGVNDSRGSGW